MGAHFAQKMVEIESDYRKSLMASSLRDSTMGINQVNESKDNNADPNKQTLTGMYLSADA
jgi:hypothetical protein